jgi:hypothetical protein
MKTRTIWTWFSWIILLALLGYLLAICTACTTINTDNAGIENYGKANWHGRNDSPPPSSINPTLIYIPRDYTISEHEFKAYVEKQERRLKSFGYTVIRTRYIPHPNDGLRWKRGDIAEAVIYYKKTD